MARWMVAFAVSLAVCSSAVHAGQAGTPAPTRIGVFADCDGPFGGFYETSLAAAMLPLIEHGATRAAAPSQGVTGAVIAGHPVEVLLGCTRDNTAVAVAEAERLIAAGATIIVGPTAGDDV